MDDKTRERTRELNIEVSQDDYKAMQNQIAAVSQQLTIAQAIAVKEKARSEELSNLVNRMQADFDNYRKRMNEGNKKLKEDGMCAVLEKIIPELDVLKQAIQTITDEKIAEGVKMIYRRILDVLTSFGVEEIPALGQQFDPNLHNAVMQTKTNDPSKVNMIVEVYNKGYKLGDRILRHSVVRVAN
ncbi:MAG: nucleotide exchange factor GrpE [Clostridiales bacterium]|nr:nucleotide exchange factor GrpE [Clostridiales bacterium]MDE6617872.1 nucleotide exchange factor GrpE [Clostridiales bacterium]MDE7405295.1 nucleotide exchange factor GrpE [Clostridiales bacterium]